MDILVGKTQSEKWEPNFLHKTEKRTSAGCVLRDYNLRAESGLSVMVTSEAKWKHSRNSEGRREKERGPATPGMLTVPLQSGKCLLAWILGQLPVHVDVLVKFWQCFGQEWNAGKQGRGIVRDAPVGRHGYLTAKKLQKWSRNPWPSPQRCWMPDFMRVEEWIYFTLFLRERR